MSKLVLFSSLGSRLPIVASIAAHALVLVAAGGSHAVTVPGAPVSDRTIDVDAFVPPPVVEESPPATEIHAPLDLSHAVSMHARASALPAHRVDPPRERSVDPREIPAEPAPVSPVSLTSDAALPRFSMVLGSVASDGVARVASGAGGGASAVAGVADEATVDERGVSVPAHLTSNGRPVYPPQARGAGLEADVPLEIVVDAHGRVVESKLLGHAGHGFDESAQRAIRTYHFTPAVRDGAPVRVRMRWTVAFRLE